jgi:hypothetical protein
MIVQKRNDVARRKLQNATVIPINLQTSQENIQKAI